MDDNGCLTFAVGGRGSRMREVVTSSLPEEATGNRRLALLLAMVMFVVAVGTSLMTVSGVRAAIALEALVSAAFILISSGLSS